MKKLITTVAAFLFIMMSAAPVMAAPKINVNGLTYQAIDQPQLLGGCTLVTLGMVKNTLGADVSITGRSISIKNNNDVLTMTLDSKSAYINGRAITLAEAPIIYNTQILVPARGVLAALGAKVGWQAGSQSLLVQYDEQCQGMSAEGILAQMETALTGCESYKMKESIDKIRINHAEYWSKRDLDFPPTYNSHVDMDMASQAKPFLFYCKTKEHRIDVEDPLGFESEAAGNENGWFLKMGKESWKRIMDSDVSITGLVWAAAGEEPTACLKQLRKSGAIISLGNSIQKNGNNYWVIHVTMSKEALPDINFGALSGSPLWYLHDEVTGKFDQVLNNTHAEMSYVVTIDQKTFLPSSISFSSTSILTDYNTPTYPRVSTPAVPISTDKNSGICEFYGFRESFAVPDVSAAEPGCMPEG